MQNLHSCRHYVFLRVRDDDDEEETGRPQAAAF